MVSAGLGRCQGGRPGVRGSARVTLDGFHRHTTGPDLRALYLTAMGHLGTVRPPAIFRYVTSSLDLRRLVRCMTWPTEVGGGWACALAVRAEGHQAQGELTSTMCVTLAPRPGLIRPEYRPHLPSSLVWPA